MSQKVTKNWRLAPVWLESIFKNLSKVNFLQHEQKNPFLWPTPVWLECASLKIFSK